jgi:ribonuclease Z
LLIDFNRERGENATTCAERWHLTARQAGHIAKQARVGRLIPFLFSARYRDRAEELTREAEESFFNRASGNV